MEKLKHSLQDNLPGNASVRMTLVVNGHHTAIIELDADVAKTNKLISEKAKDAADRRSNLGDRIAAIENTRYRRFGRWIKTSIFRMKRKA